MKKSELRQIIKEEIKNLQENKVDDYYYQITDLIKKISKNLNDDDCFELHEKLKKFFNRLL